MENTKLNIFIFEENNICYKNDSSIYDNIMLNTGTIIKGQFENQICTTMINDDIKIITTSNH